MFNWQRLSLPESINKMKLFNLHDLTKQNEVDSNGYIKIKENPSIKSFLRQKVSMEKLNDLKEKLKQRDEKLLSRNNYQISKTESLWVGNFNKDHRSFKTDKNIINLRYSKFWSGFKSNLFSHILSTSNIENENDKLSKVLNDKQENQSKV